MSDSITNSPEGIERAAHAWLERQHDGLSATEEAALQDWLHADLRHAQAYGELKREWDRFSGLAEAVELASSGRELRLVGSPDRPAARDATKQWNYWWAFAPYFAAAAVLAITFASWRQLAPAHPPAVALALPAPCEQRTLPDGSLVELNRGAEIAFDFSTSERRVRLLRGEANFTVAKSPERPFVVDAGGVHVRALGTVFNVRFDPSEVQVVVIEGKVRVDPPVTTGVATATGGSSSSFLEANQKTIVPLVSATVAPAVVTLAQPDLEKELLWQPKLLDFDNASLGEIAAEFNRRNPVRLVVDHETLGDRRMTATIRSDNVEGFIRLLEANLDIRAERQGEREILLTRR